MGVIGSLRGLIARAGASPLYPKRGGFANTDAGTYYAVGSVFPSATQAVERCRGAIQWPLHQARQFCPPFHGHLLVVREAVGVRALPAPKVLAHLLEVALGSPLELGVRRVRLRVARLNITRPPVL